MVDIKNGTNARRFELLAGNIDLFNNFAPKNAIKGKIKTYFGKSPYHLGANTDWLFPNTTEKPLERPGFRRALATSINLKQILDKAYQGLVNKANPTGLLPIWNKWIDKNVVNEYGFSYSTAKAKQILAAAGYKDTNNDGYVENKDGSPINLKIVCPNGWSDWMTAIQVIPTARRLPGSRSRRRIPSTGRWPTTAGTAGSTSLLGNDRQYSNTPWTYSSTSTSCRFRRTRRRSTTSATRPERLEPDAGSWTRRRRRTPRRTRQ